MTKNYKLDFPLLMKNPTVYLDNAATAQRPTCVLDAVQDFYTCKNANPLRGLYELSVEATRAYEESRRTVQRFIGAKSADEIIFTEHDREYKPYRV